MTEAVAQAIRADMTLFMTPRRPMFICEVATNNYTTSGTLVPLSFTKCTDLQGNPVDDTPECIYQQEDAKWAAARS